MTEATQAAPAEKKKTEVETVTMTDGRKVDFPGKRKLQKESFEDPHGHVHIRLDFRNGKTITYTPPKSLHNKFIAHGAEQKLGDEIAGLDDIDDAVLAVEQLAARLTGPDGWTVAREGNGLAGTSVLARALSEVKGVDIEKVKAFLATKTQAQKIALRNDPAIKPTVEKIEAEKAAKGNKVDTAALLGELA